MTNCTLPQDPYIDAVVIALADAGWDVADSWTSDADTHGLHQYLNAALTLTPEDSGLDAGTWPEGLILIWEWHNGIEAGEPERGARWQWAKKNRDGSSSEPALFPVDGYANPVQVAAAAGELVATGRAVKRRPGQWNGTPGLQEAIAAWEATS